MRALWRIEMLGWLRCSRADRVVARFRTHKTGALLAFLAFHHHRSHPREFLIELFWPECEPAAGRDSLSTALVWLRRQLEPPDVPRGSVLLADRATVRLNPEACVFDVEEFEAAVEGANRAASAADRVEQFARAVDLYQGELLPGYFDAWVVSERQRLTDTLLHALRQLAVELEQAGDRPRALDYAHRAAATCPLYEEAHGDLLRALVGAQWPEGALPLSDETRRCSLQAPETAAGRLEPGMNAESREGQGLRGKLAERTAELQELRSEIAQLRRLLRSG